ncbi:MAG: NAD(+) diphosphatase [Bacteroides sp.]|nr:NAD(+) diphosphatase [Roseburia sp.]MCM1347579.1 NAD(+) diphosphatase [Bacteroides sp.]MCM1421071.1 NAD(+) diphosphatase [Bacteroides sp.]
MCNAKELQEKKYWFVFCDGNILLEMNGMDTVGGKQTSAIPLSVMFPLEREPEGDFVQALPDLDGVSCVACTISSVPALSADKMFVGLRDSYKLLPKSMYEMAAKASELLYWNSNTKYCGSCGAPTRRQTVISKVCTGCGKEIWPQVSPAVIVRICRRHEGKEWILLVHARNFKRNFYGLVAGFLETGETLEQCVEREVKEETNLKIKNVRYFGSQPWPFPCGVMIGFTADYDSGELRLQDEELSSGGWFTRDNMPEIPDKISIARMLIDDWLEIR